jgi:hypothetical protein
MTTFSNSVGYTPIMSNEWIINDGLEVEELVVACFNYQTAKTS